eukprot:jgi/Bigna1/145369/aug1.98_g20077
MTDTSRDAEIMSLLLNKVGLGKHLKKSCTHEEDGRFSTPSPLNVAHHDWADVLSGGEKQRVGWARLFFHKPKFAILDEATAAINPDEESKLYEELAKLDVTFFSIAHRLNLRRFHQKELNLAGDGTGAYSLKEISTSKSKQYTFDSRNIWEYFPKNLPKTFFRRRKWTAFARAETAEPISSEIIYNNDLKECCICKEESCNKFMKTQCGHVFGKVRIHRCIAEKIKKGHNPECPICRSTIDSKNLKPISQLATSIQSMKSNLDTDKCSTEKDSRLCGTKRISNVFHKVGTLLEWRDKYGNYLKGAIEFISHVLVPEMKDIDSFPEELKQHAENLRETLERYDEGLTNSRMNLHEFDEAIDLSMQNIEKGKLTKTQFANEILRQCVENCETQSKDLFGIISKLEKNNDALQATRKSVSTKYDELKRRKGINAAFLAGGAVVTTASVVLTVIPMVNFVAAPAAVAGAGGVGTAYQAFRYLTIYQRLMSQLKEVHKNLKSLIGIVQSRRKTIESLRRKFQIILRGMGGVEERVKSNSPDIFFNRQLNKVSSLIQATLNEMTREKKRPENCK